MESARTSLARIPPAMEGDKAEGEQFAEGEEWADYQTDQEDWLLLKQPMMSPSPESHVRGKSCISTSQGCNKGSTETFRKVSFGRGRRPFGTCHGSWSARRACTEGASVC